MSVKQMGCKNYAALSYCWGTSQHRTSTTTATLSAKTQGIHFGTPPKTVRDAIITTRRLGLQFFWIDALCILQDSEIDKAKQINAMGSIFKNATITIAAASTADVSQGFLSVKSQTKPSQLQFLLQYPMIAETRNIAIGLCCAESKSQNA